MGLRAFCKTKSELGPGQGCAEEEKGPSKPQQFPVHGRCQELHRFPFRVYSTAQTCWSLLPLLLGELNSVLQHQVVTKCGCLWWWCWDCCAWELSWGTLPALLCPITMPHLHASSLFSGPACCAWAPSAFSCHTHQSGYQLRLFQLQLRALAGLSVSLWSLPCSLGAFPSLYRKRNSQ